jgi:ABC-type branched-subunit amino acid transport system substrate-binding protein
LFPVVFLSTPEDHGFHFQEEAIRIGLLLPDTSHMGVTKAAELAIDQANREGGYNGNRFELVVRTAEGFWGAGSKESVNLVYEDNVRAIVGSLDGRNGHLAEQVATKSHLAYIECLATEPTLSQAFVPWFSRVVPNDNQQARALVAEIQARGGGVTAILTSGDYDCRHATKSLTKALASADVPVLRLEVKPGTADADSLVHILLDAGTRQLILPFAAPLIDRMIVSLRQKEPDFHLYGTLHFHMNQERRAPSLDAYEGMVMAGSMHPWTRSGQLLVKEWFEQYGTLPHLEQVYVYDAVKCLIAVIRKAGPDREKVSQLLLESSCEDAVTGSIRYDELGNRLDAVTLVVVRHGNIILYETKGSR